MHRDHGARWVDEEVSRKTADTPVDAPCPVASLCLRAKSAKALGCSRKNGELPTPKAR